jgi:hypothetical protein
VALKANVIDRSNAVPMTEEDDFMAANLWAVQCGVK